MLIAEEERIAEIFSADIQFVVSGKTVRGFTIRLSQPSPADLTFSWIALAVRNAKTFSSRVPAEATLPLANVEPAGAALPAATPSATEPAAELLPASEAPPPVIDGGAATVEPLDAPGTPSAPTPSASEGAEPLPDDLPAAVETVESLPTPSSATPEVIGEPLNDQNLHAIPIEEVAEPPAPPEPVEPPPTPPAEEAAPGVENS